VPSEREPAPPERSLSPPGFRVELDERGFDARVRGKHALLRRLAPWLAPMILSALGTIGGGVLGYFEGLKRASARVAALELETEAEKLAIRARKLDDDRLFVVTDDHEGRVLRLERQLKLESPKR
jgi:hypothetical protein